MKALKTLLLLLFFLEIIQVHSKNIRYRCGVDDEKIPVLPAEHYNEIDQNHPAYKRRLYSGEFKDFHIYLDLVNIKKDIEKFNLQDKEQLYINALTNAVKTLEALLKVKPLSRGFTFTDQQITNIQIPDWNKTVVGSSATLDLASQDIDLIIFGRFDDQMPESTLATAGPRYSDDNRQPIIGVVNINAKIDYSKKNSEHSLQTTLLHEFTHILGFLNNYFTDVYKNVFNRTDEDNVVRSYINSPKVLEVAKKYFNCDSIDGVEL